MSREGNRIGTHKSRFAIALAALVLSAPAGAIAQPSARHPVLARYFSKIDGEIRSYQGLLKQFDRLFSDAPQVNVDPLVEELYRLADRFEDLTRRWSDIPATHGLRVRHRGMERAFELFAEAIRIHAAAVFTRHPEEIVAALARIEPRLRSAAYLQKRWAAALRGALIRADVRIPKWLDGMATLGP